MISLNISQLVLKSSNRGSTGGRFSNIGEHSFLSLQFVSIKNVPKLARTPESNKKIVNKMTINDIKDGDLLDLFQEIKMICEQKGKSKEHPINNSSKAKCDRSALFLI